MAKIKCATIKINVTFQKIMFLISGLWLFILTILNSFLTVNVNTKLFVNNNIGDNGIIILIISFLFIFVTIFVHHKVSKLIVGIIFIVLIIIGIVGAIITSIKEISTWLIIIGELIAAIGALIFILEGIIAIKSKKTNIITNNK